MYQMALREENHYEPQNLILGCFHVDRHLILKVNRDETNHYSLFEAIHFSGFDLLAVVQHNFIISDRLVSISNG